MKNLIIGLGGCGNNNINLIQDQLDNSFKTISIQKDLQLLTISNADFKLNIKDRDFENKLASLVKYGKKMILILGTSGNSSVLYLDKLVGYFKINRIPFDIIAIQANKIEGNIRLENSKKVSKQIVGVSRNYFFIKEQYLKEADEKVIEFILDYSINLKKAIEKIKEKKMCISDAYAIGSCSTCGCGTADKLIKKIENIEVQLKSFDIEKMLRKSCIFSSYRDMPIELKIIIFIFYRVRLDKEKVLDYWIENLSNDCIRFFDAILFYVVRRIKISEILRKKWFNRCYELANKFDDNSLKETVNYCLE